MKLLPIPRCRHKVAGIDARVIVRGKDGYVAWCLLCEISGPARTDPHTARLALLSDERTPQRVENESQKGRSGGPRTRS